MVYCSYHQDQPCKAYTGAFLHEPGANFSCIADQVARYLLFCNDLEKNEQKKIPIKDGVLIFDEVKVINQLMWNSRSQKLIGICMSHLDQSSLADIYQVMYVIIITSIHFILHFVQDIKDDATTKQTSYILQFLWRNLTSSFDIVGPYYTSSKTLESKFIYSCVIETLKLFHLHGLKTSLLVCDGAASNLTTIKAMSGCFGAYSINKGKVELYVLTTDLT